MTSETEADFRRCLAEAESQLSLDPASALDLADRAVSLADADGLPAADRALARRTRAHALRLLERHEDALEEYARARRGFLRARDPAQAARTLIGRVDALAYLDRFDAARRTGTQALRELEEAGDAVSAGRLLTNLGNLEFRLDRPQAAARYYGRATELLAGRVPELDLAIVGYNYANALVPLGRLDEADATLSRAEGAAREANHAALRAHVEFSRAEVERLRGQYPEALQRLDRAEQQFAALGMDRPRTHCSLDRAAIYRQLSLDPEALHAATLAEKSFRRLGLKMDALRALAIRGVAALGLGEVAAARRRLERAIRELAELGNDALAASLEVERSQRDPRPPDDVEDRLKRSMATLDRLGLAGGADAARLELARRALGADHVRAATRTLAGLDPQRSGRLDLAVRADHLTMLVDERAGRAREAARAARRCRQQLERLRLRSGAELLDAHVAGVEDIYRDVVRVAAAQHADRPEPHWWDLLALEAGLENARPRAGRESVRVREARAKLAALTAPADLLGRSRRAPAREVRRAERELLEAMRRDSGVLAVGETDGEDLAAKLRGRLAADELWLHAYDAGTEIGLLAVRADGVERLPPISTARLRRALRRMNYRLEVARLDPKNERHGAAAAQAIERLGNLVLPSVRSALAGVRRVRIRPAGGLEALPWSAFSEGDAPLGERVVISFVPGALAFVGAVKQPSTVEHELMVFGYGGDDLPAVEAEARTLAAGTANARVFLGRDCSRANFLAQAGNASLLHFAGHAEFRADNPVFSSLRLADGPLTFLDVERLSLGARAVVLAACRTGAARPGLGLGMGLARGFLVAGARNLVVSLWAIGDEETQEWTEFLYQNLAEGHDVAVATRKANLALSYSGRLGPDWGAFQVIGID